MPAASSHRWQASAPGWAGGERVVRASSRRASQPSGGNSCASIPAPYSCPMMPEPGGGRTRMWPLCTRARRMSSSCL
eukprot:9322537-Pyramimonas_sp.AAC.1